MVSRMARNTLLTLLAVLILLWPGMAASGQSRHFLWKVSSDSGFIYLLGSVHMAKPDLYPLDNVIEKAFDESEALVVEADINSMEQTEVQKWVLGHGLYPEGQNLAENISDRTKKLAERMRIDFNLFGRMRPWLLAITLQAQTLIGLGYSETYGVDRHFLGEAAGSGKPVLELEGMEYQLRLFAEMSKREQDLFLYSTLVELEDTATMIHKIMSTWKTGDAPGFADVFFRGLKRYPELMPLAEKLIFSRNVTMTEKIVEYLGTGRPHFIVIGAGHLAGPKSILEKLKAQGFRVEQM